MRHTMTHNVPHGKLIRSQILIAAGKYLAKGKENCQQLYNLGWVIEMIQGSACIVDDLVDRSLTRRGRPCWHQHNNLGLAALNDGILLENLSYRLLELNFKDEPFHSDLVSLLHGTAVKALCGQSYDVTNAGLGNYHKLNMRTYSNMMKFKNGFYTFYAPFEGALILNGIRDVKMARQLEEVTLEMGLLYSIQDDFMDVFVDESLTGKKGTDIADGKFSWPLVVALDKAADSQKHEIFKNYGRNNEERVKRVREIYQEIGIPELYKEYVRASQENISRFIQQLPEILPQQLLHNVVDVLIGRTR